MPHREQKRKTTRKTNAELALEKHCTPRQIGKSRRRGWIWVPREGTTAPSSSKTTILDLTVLKREKYTAPMPKDEESMLKRGVTLLREAAQRARTEVEDQLSLSS